MAKIDANSAFAKGKALTQPVVKLPRSVKQSLCIDKAYSSGNFKIEPMNGEAMYDQCYLFEDINYVNKDIHKKDTTLREIMNLLKSLDGAFKITIANEQREMNEFMDEIFNPINAAEYPILEDGMGKWINQKLDEGTKDIKKTMMLTVTCRAHSIEEAEAYFSTVDTTLQNVFRMLKSRIYKMSALERMALLSRMLKAGKESLPPAHISPDDSGWKNQILPSSIDSDVDYTNRVRIGSYMGFDLYSRYNFMYNGYELYIQGKKEHWVELSKDPVGVITRINNCLDGLDKKLEKAQSSLSDVYQKLESAKIEAAKEFDKEDELNQKLERLSELNALLDMDEKREEKEKQRKENEAIKQNKEISVHL